jgi:feruloyl esterase
MLQADRDDVLGSTSTDLKAFFDRGGKLLMYHGWSDAQVTPLNSIDYFNKVVDRFGRPAVGKSIQLYMVPGMNHCQGGNGTDQFDKVASIEQWVATGTAPARISASHLTAGTVDRTRPLCPYGQVATWDGRNSTNDASSFACAPAR